MSGSRVSREHLNLLCLGGVNVTNLIVPLVTLPVLSRGLGGTTFGELMFVLLAIQLTCLVVDYAFAYSGVRALAQVAGVKADLQDVYRRVQSARFLLLIAILPVGLGVFHALSFESGPGGFVLYVLPYLLGHFLLAQWFHQGVSDLLLPSACIALARLAYLAGAVLAVQRPDDLPQLLVINGVSMLLAGIVVAMHRARRYAVPYRLELSGGLRELRQGANLFVGDFAPNLYNNIPHLLLAGAVPPAAYGAYMASVRILSAAQSMLYTITHAYFPRVASNAADSRRRYAALCVGTAVVMAAALAALAGPIVAVLLAVELSAASSYLAVSAVGIVFVAIALVAGPGTLVARGHDRLYRNVNLSLSIAGGAAALLVVPHHGTWGVLTVLLATRVAIAAVLAFLAWRQR